MDAANNHRAAATDLTSDQLRAPEGIAPMKALLAIVVALGLASSAAEAGSNSYGHGHGHRAVSYGHKVHSGHGHSYRAPSYGHVQTYNHAPRHNSYGHVSTYRHVPTYVAPVYSYQPAYKPAHVQTYSYGAPHKRVVFVQQGSKPVVQVEPKQELKASEGPVIEAPIVPAPEVAPEAPQK